MDGRSVSQGQRARTKALALMLAAACLLDLRTGARIDSGRALAMANDMQYHHFFPKGVAHAQ